MSTMFVFLCRQILKARLNVPHDVTIGYEVRYSELEICVLMLHFSDRLTKGLVMSRIMRVQRNCGFVSSGSS